MRRWPNVGQTCSVNMFQMEDRKKVNATGGKHHRLENALRNRERGDSGDSNGALNGHTEPVSSCDATEESDGRRGR